MRNNSSAELLKILEDDMIINQPGERIEIWKETRHQIEKAQETYKNNFVKKRKGHHGYQLGDLVAIKVTQFITGKKLANKYMGPYEVIQVIRNDRYDVKKASDFEGPQQTSTSADFMKLWRYASNKKEDENLSTEEDEASGRDICLVYACCDGRCIVLSGSRSFGQSPLQNFAWTMHLKDHKRKTARLIQLPALSGLT